MTETTRRRYSWRHGWWPLTMRAALQKAKGNHELARRLLDEGRAHRQRRRAERGRVEFRHPLTADSSARASRALGRWAALSDDQLADALGSADDATVDAITAELDRRDRVEQERRRRQARRAERDAARDAEFSTACDAGEDPAAAYARIYGVSEERQRRVEATESLRSAGYPGKTFRAMVKSAHAEHVRETYLDAEAACRGHVLNAAGQAAGVDPESLWSGPAARVKKYASEELRDYLRDNGRMTLADFTASLLGGQARHRTAGDDW